MAHDHVHRREHRHEHPHGSMHLVPPDELRRMRRPVHDIGRRRFLTELGRGTFAVAILGGLAAACSSDDSADPGAATDATDPSAEPVPSSTNAPSTSAPATNAASTSAPATNAPSTAPPDATDQPEAPAALQWSQVLLGNVSAYVLVRGNEAAVVDTGNPGSAERIGETLATLGVTYDDVRHVVLTHHHPDHIGSLPDVMGRAAAAGVYAGEADIPNISSPVTISAVGDGDDVFGLEIINTPGHTPGSISVLDTGIGLLIAGDALNGNADGTGISGANERFTADMGIADESVRKLAGLDFDIAAFGHGNPVDMGAGALVDALVDSP